LLNRYALLAYLTPVIRSFGMSKKLKNQSETQKKLLRSLHIKGAFMKKQIIILASICLLLVSGCNPGSSSGGSNGDDHTPGQGGSSGTGTSNYILHSNITVTIFWTGEAAGPDNGNISNVQSAWDENWTRHYGGYDSPSARRGYKPAAFDPLQNPFYCALPYNDISDNGRKADALDIIPWAAEKSTWLENESLCKNRWIKIIKNSKTAYAQWEDAGPFGEDDQDYVFGNASPANQTNQNAGLDVSPAVRDDLGLADIDRVDWQFVDFADVPDGPWKETITYHQLDYDDLWYRPQADTSWNWQLTGAIDTSVPAALYDIDLFESSEALIETLQNEGKKVICYFSAGSYESYRSDSDRFMQSDLGKKLQGWEDERWLDIRSRNVRNIMQARLDMAVQKGCDGVEPDNVDGYANNTGLGLRAADQLDYNRFIAAQAHMRGLSVALKNDLEQAAALEPFFDFAINEQCHEYDECDLLDVFILNGKPVLNAEYRQDYVDDPAQRNALCADSIHRGFNTLVLPVDLDGSFRYACD